MGVLAADARLGRAGATRVVFDPAADALYFSKRMLPYPPEPRGDAPVYFHLGVYAYRHAVSDDYVQSPPSPLERIERLEMRSPIDSAYW